MIASAMKHHHLHLWVTSLVLREDQRGSAELRDLLRGEVADAAEDADSHIAPQRHRGARSEVDGGRP